MKKFLFGWICLVWLMGSCAPVTPAPPVETAQGKPTVAAVMDSSHTPSPLPTARPTETSVPATRTITPLPAIPTFTPTFDARTIVTVTPVAEKAECPKETSTMEFNPELTNSVDGPNKQFTDYTINFLNSGGTANSIKASYTYPNGIIQEKDLTGDGINELIIAYGIWLDIFGCKGGKYQLFNEFTRDGAQGSAIIDVVDTNQNGLLDLVGYFDACFGDRCPSIDIYEWNGNEFKSLISVNSECWQAMSAPLEVKIKDLNHDGIKEITLTHNGKPWPDGLGYPYRAILHICAWNGNGIDLLSSEYVQPIYRYQALQDGDFATLAGNFPKALNLYSRVISDETLEWFTEERNNYDFWVYRSEYFPSFSEPTPTVSPSLQPNLAELPSLVAYAYYRIMLIHLVQNYESDAGTVYNTLQQKFGTDPNGRPYAEMATAFWEAYQSTHEMYDGCAAAIQYAAEHPAILIPLGSDYHGWQSHTYVPVDVCPFR